MNQTANILCSVREERAYPAEDHFQAIYEFLPFCSRSFCNLFNRWLKRPLMLLLLLLLQFFCLGQTSAGKKVLLVGADDVNWISDVQSKLVATGKFDRVDLYQADMGTPTVTMLQLYDAVLVWANRPFFNGVVLGDNLVSYINGGGGVVVAMMSLRGDLGTQNSFGPSFANSTYQVIVPGLDARSASSMGTVLLPSHPIMQGVQSFNGYYKTNSATLSAGSYAIANWGQGYPLIAAKDDIGPAHSKRVDINMYPISGSVHSTFGWDVTTDGAQIMANALLYAAKAFCSAEICNNSIDDNCDGAVDEGCTVVNSSTITTIAGTGVQGYSGDGGPAINAQLGEPFQIAVDPQGNLYLTDQRNHRIRRVTPSGVISTIAGTGTQGYSGDSGPATSAQFNYPTGIALDAAGNIYIADNNQTIRKINTAGVITTIAGSGTSGFSGDGGPATSAKLSLPIMLAVDATGNIYVADYNNQRIRKITPAGIITTIAGNGTPGSSGDGGLATNAQLGYPTGVAVDAAGNVYITEESGSRIRKVSTSGIITTFAGTTQGFSGDGGLAINAQLNNPYGLKFDAAGNLYFTDGSNHRVRKINTDGIISTVAGNGTGGFGGDGGPALNAQLQYPADVAFDASGNLYISDNMNNRIRKIGSTSSNTYYRDVDGDGYGNPAQSSSSSSPPPGYVANNTDCNDSDPVINPAALEVCDGKDNNCNGSTDEGYSSTTPPFLFTVAGAGNAGQTGENIPATDARIEFPQGVAVDAAGNIYYSEANRHRVRKVTPQGIVTTIAGTGTAGFSGDGGPATSAQLRQPAGIAVDAAGNVYISDYLNWRIRKVNTNGVITTIAGNGNFSFGGDGGPATSASIWAAFGLAVDGAGNIYIGDGNNHRVRKINSATGIITTIAGNGIRGYSGDGGAATSARLAEPAGLSIDASGNVYVADLANSAIRKIGPSGIITTVAGTGVTGYSGDGGPAVGAKLYNPYGIVADKEGNLYIADGDNNRIRKVSGDGTISTVAGNGTPGFSGDGGGALCGQLYRSTGIAIDKNNILYIADFYNNRIRAVGEKKTYYADADGDGFGNPSASITVLTQPGGYVANNTDCKDNDAAVNPGATEVCDGKDNNCNGQIDEGATIIPTITISMDRTTVCGGELVKFTATSTGGGTSPIYTWKKNGSLFASGSQNTLEAVNFQNGEVITCELTSNLNCASPKTVTSNSITVVVTTPLLFFRDADGDGFGNGAQAINACVQPEGYVANSRDCNDNSDVVYPNAPEICDGKDNNCNGQIDEGGTIIPTITISMDRATVCGGELVRFMATVSHPGPNSIYTWKKNGSLFASGTQSILEAVNFQNGDVVTCDFKSTAPCVSTEVVTSNKIIVPVVYPVTFYRDADGDGFGTYEQSISACSAPTGYVANHSDCRDNDERIYPGAIEVCDGIDNDCDGLVDEGLQVTPSIVINAISNATNVCRDDVVEFTAIITNGGEQPILAWLKNGQEMERGSSLNFAITNLEDGDVISCQLINNSVCASPNTAISNSITITVAPSVYFYRDNDGDSYGDPFLSVWSCTPPAGYVADNTDCNDNDAAVHAAPIEQSAVGGSYCSGEAGFSVTMNNSEIGVTYQMGRNGLPIGTPKVGTGGSISFDKQPAGFYYIKAINAGGCSINFGNIAITQIPVSPVTATANPNTVCKGSIVNLLGSPLGGLWSASNPMVQAAISGNILKTESLLPGQYALTYTSYQNGCAATGSVLVTVLAPLPVVANNASVCAGGVVQLTGSPAGGTWSGVGVSASGLFTSAGLNAGAYTVTYTVVQNGCIASAPATVSVQAAPAVTVNNINTCLGNNVALGGSPAGGVWSSADPMIDAAIVGTTFNALDIPVGSYPITYTVTTAGGCTASANATLSVHPRPAFSAFGSAYCSGSTGSITVSPFTTSIMVQLATEDGTLVGAPRPGNAGSVVFDGLVAGIYKVTGTSTVSGCSNSIMVQVVMNPGTPAPLTTNVTRCGPGTATLTASGPAGSTIQWYASSTDVSPFATGPTITVTTSFTTNYYATAVVNGCESQKAMARVTVNTAPAASYPVQGGSYCAGEVGAPVVLMGSQGGVSYQLQQGGLSKGPVYAGTGGPINFDPQSAGTYTVLATGSDGCTATLGPVTVTVLPTPAAPITTGAVRCEAGTVTLSALGCSGGQLAWYTSISSTSPVHFGEVFTTTVSSTTTFYVACQVNGCVSARTPVTAVVGTTPTVSITAPEVLNLSVSNTAILTATVNGTSSAYQYQWGQFPADGNTTLSGTHTAQASFTVNSTTSFEPSYFFTAIVTTPEGCVETADVEVKVQRNPIITWAEPAGIAEGAALTAVQLNASVDVPGTLTYSPSLGTVLPAGNKQALTVEFVPEDLQRYTKVSKTVYLTVNGAPVLTLNGPSTVAEETLYTLAASATDVNGDALTYSLQGSIPQGVSINAVTGQVNWIPSEVQGPGPFTITVRATDNGVPSLFKEQTVSLFVEEVNVAPVLTHIGDKLLAVGGNVNFKVTATDVDVPVQQLTYAMSGLPSGAQFNPATQEFLWLPSGSQVGQHKLYYTVSDGVVTSVDSVYITVEKAKNAAPPTITSYTPSRGPIGTFVTITGTNFTGCQVAMLNAQGQPVLVNNLVINATGIQLTFNVPPGVVSGRIYVSGSGGTASTNTFRITTTATITTQSSESRLPETEVGTAFKVTAYPNPTTTLFRLTLESSSQEPISYRVVDLLGRVLEAKAHIAATGTIHFGHNYRNGVYFVEVVQGAHKQVIKLVKQAD